MRGLNYDAGEKQKLEKERHLKAISQASSNQGRRDLYSDLSINSIGPLEILNGEIEERSRSKNFIDAYQGQGPLLNSSSESSSSCSQSENFDALSGSGIVDHEVISTSPAFWLPETNEQSWVQTSTPGSFTGVPIVDPVASLDLWQKPRNCLADTVRIDSNERRRDVCKTSSLSDRYGVFLVPYNITKCF